MILPLVIPTRRPRRHQPRRRADASTASRSWPRSAADALASVDRHDRRRRAGRRLLAGRPASSASSCRWPGPVLLAGIRVVSVSTIALVSVGVHHRLGEPRLPLPERQAARHPRGGRRRHRAQPAARADLRPGHRDAREGPDALEPRRLQPDERTPADVSLGGVRTATIAAGGVGSDGPPPERPRAGSSTAPTGRPGSQSPLPIQDRLVEHLTYTVHRRGHRRAHRAAARLLHRPHRQGPTVRHRLHRLDARAADPRACCSSC